MLQTARDLKKVNHYEIAEHFLITSLNLKTWGELNASHIKEILIPQHQIKETSKIGGLDSPHYVIGVGKQFKPDPLFKGTPSLKNYADFYGFKILEEHVLKIEGSLVYSKKKLGQSSPSIKKPHYTPKAKRIIIKEKSFDDYMVSIKRLEKDLSGKNDQIRAIWSAHLYKMFNLDSVKTFSYVKQFTLAQNP